MSGEPLTVLESLRAQQAACAAIGSPLYGSLLGGLVVDYERGGITAVLLDPVSRHPHNDAVPLRYLATGHRLALIGSAPGLAAHYPSCGGTWDGGGDVVDDFLATVASAPDAFTSGLRRGVQTNEVGRAPVLACGFALIAARHRLPIDQFEIGASAGLLSRWDFYRYDNGTSTCGPRNSPVAFGPEWWTGPVPDLGSTVAVHARHANDIAPIEGGSPDGQATMLSFLWPDQLARIERMRAAAAIATDHPVTIDPGDAGEWIAANLAEPLRAGIATVLFHSIVWQYLPPATKDRIRSALTAAARTAGADSPLFWLRMEPASAAHADLRLTSWLGGAGIDEHLADVGYHGAGIRWSAPA